ncbi:MAG: exo-alpha-sialidase [Porphyromonadaceae bacterium]|nr:exo-alpha-sialidase [Porphyromonadaceae bacterium]
MKRLVFIGSLLGLSLGSITAQISHKSTIELDGVSQYLKLSAHRDFGIGQKDDYTLTFWFRGDRTITYAPSQRILSHRSTLPKDSTHRSGYEVMVLRNTAKNLAGVDLLDATGSTNKGLSLWAAAPNRSELRDWHHVAMVLTRREKRLKIYIDGQMQAEKPLPSEPHWQTAEGTQTLIGCGTDQGKPYAFFGGQLDNIRFYRSALSAQEVQTDLCTEVISDRKNTLVAAFDFEDYRPGDSIIVDQTGRHRLHFEHQRQVLPHKIVKTLKATPTNNHLIGRHRDQALLSLNLGLAQKARLVQATLRLDGSTDLSDIQEIKVYQTDNADRFDPRERGILLLSGKPTTTGLVNLAPTGYEGQLSGQTKLWVVADINPKAKEGNKLISKIESLEFATEWGKNSILQDIMPEATDHEIVLSRTLIWTPGENNSAHYRIPALVRLDNGTLVAAIDKRKNSEYDLPEDIDVEVKLSHDNGLSWSKPITVAQGSPEHGFGDAAIATDGKTLHMVMVAGSGLWFYPSSAEKPLEMYYTRSTDGGRTWLPVREITQEVYTDRYPNGGFFGSGNGIVTSTGRIAFVAAMRVDEKWGGQMDNVLVYSDDFGATWHSSPVARTNGDEAKVLELADSSLLISSRNRAYKMTPRTYVRSYDGGKTWTEPKVWEDLQGNACNSALTRYSLKATGASHNIILHTLLEANDRSNLKIYMSQDEGQTWPRARTLCRGEAAYSEIAILPDGTIGIISEENDRPGYDIYFTRISLDWLQRGNNQYHK